MEPLDLTGAPHPRGPNPLAPTDFRSTVRPSTVGRRPRRPMTLRARAPRTATGGGDAGRPTTSPSEADGSDMGSSPSTLPAGHAGGGRKRPSSHGRSRGTSSNLSSPMYDVHPSGGPPGVRETFEGHLRRNRKGEGHPDLWFRVTSQYGGRETGDPHFHRIPRTRTGTESLPHRSRAPPRPERTHSRDIFDGAVVSQPSSGSDTRPAALCRIATRRCVAGPGPSSRVDPTPDPGSASVTTVDTERTATTRQQVTMTGWSIVEVCPDGLSGRGVGPRVGSRGESHPEWGRCPGSGLKNEPDQRE